MESVFRRHTLAIASLIIFTISAVSSYAFADYDGKTELSLRKAVALALERNRDILVMEKEIETARARILGARGQYMPRVDIYGSYTQRDAVMDIGLPQGSDGRKDFGVFAGYEDEKRAGISLVQQLFNPAIPANLERAKIDLKIQEESLNSLKLDVEFDVSRLYHGMLLAHEKERIARDLLEQAESHHDVVKNKYDEGTVSEFDLLQSKVQVSRVKPDLVRAENERESLTADFRKVTGLGAWQDLMLPDDLKYAPTDMGEKQFLEIAYEKKPEFLIKTLAIKAEKQNIRAAKASGRPRVYANIDYYYVSDDLGDMFNSEHNNWNAGLTVSIPLFDGFQARAKVEEAQARRVQARLRREDVDEAVALEVKKGVLALRQAKSIIESQEEAVLVAEKALKIATARYASGAGTNLDVLDAQISRSIIENNLKQAVHDYIVAEARMNKIIGISLFEED